MRITAYDFDHYRYVPDYNEFGFSYHEEVFKFYNYVQKEYVQPAFNMDSLYCYSSATNDWPNTAGKSKNGGSAELGPEVVDGRRSIEAVHARWKSQMRD